MDFKLHSPYQPTGDQPEAIEQLVKGVESGMTHQVLLGRHRHRQDLHHRQCDPADAEAGAGDGA